MFLKEGVYPNINKEAVCPIFNKGNMTKCENYRLISLLLNLSKIFEQIMYTHKHFLISSEILYKFQFEVSIIVKTTK